LEKKCVFTIVSCCRTNSIRRKRICLSRQPLLCLGIWANTAYIEEEYQTKFINVEAALAASKNFFLYLSQTVRKFESSTLTSCVQICFTQFDRYVLVELWLVFQLVLFLRRLQCRHHGTGYIVDDARVCVCRDCGSGRRFISNRLLANTTWLIFSCNVGVGLSFFGTTVALSSFS
jgi:hypothetical protein